MVSEVIVVPSFGMVCLYKKVLGSPSVEVWLLPETLRLVTVRGYRVFDIFRMSIGQQWKFIAQVTVPYMAPESDPNVSEYYDLKVVTR